MRRSATVLSAVFLLVACASGSVASGPAASTPAGATTSGPPIAGATPSPSGSDVAVCAAASGNPSYKLAQSFAAPNSAYELAVADFNGDGIPDVAVTGDGPTTSVLLGVGDGTMVPGEPVSGGSSGANVLAADLNGDGKTDLVLSDQLGSVAVALGRGDGTFADPVSHELREMPANLAWTVVAGDLNGDDQPDLMVAIYGAGDFDRSAPGRLAVLLNKGEGTYADPVFYDDPAAVAVVAGDFNGDGALDAATASLSGSARVFLGDGSGRLKLGGVYPIGTGVAIAAGDIVGDGVLDLVTGNDAGHTVSILKGLGDGSFQGSDELVAGNTHSVSMIDLNGDGHLDILSGGYDETSVRYYRGVGDGTFQDEVLLDTHGPGVRDLAVTDLDGDGKLDLVVANGEARARMLLAC